MGFMVVVLVLILFDQSLLGRILGDVENWYFNLDLLTSGEQFA